jgi:hypothetical protein
VGAAGVIYNSTPTKKGRGEKPVLARGERTKQKGEGTRYSMFAMIYLHFCPVFMHSENSQV